MNKLWDWFGLSYSSFLVLPRSLMHEMPEQWQEKMAELLHEYDETFDTSGVCQQVIVCAKNEENRFMHLPQWLLNYRHPDKKTINAHRIVGQIDK